MIGMHGVPESRLIEKQVDLIKMEITDLISLRDLTNEQRALIAQDLRLHLSACETLGEARFSRDAEIFKIHDFEGEIR